MALLYLSMLANAMFYEKVGELDIINTISITLTWIRHELWTFRIYISGAVVSTLDYVSAGAFNFR